MACGDGKAKIGDGAAELAFGGLLAAEDLLEKLGAVTILDEDFGDGGVRVGVLGEGLETGVDDFGFDADVAALEPVEADDVVEEGLFGGGFGAVLVAVGACDGGERLRIFAGEDGVWA